MTDHCRICEGYGVSCPTCHDRLSSLEAVAEAARGIATLHNAPHLYDTDDWNAELRDLEQSLAALDGEQK